MNCGNCKSPGHSARTCASATEPSRLRTKDVTDNLFGRDKEREREGEASVKHSYTHSAPRILFAPRGPRYRADGSYHQPYRFSPKFTMALDGTVMHKAVAVA